MSFATKPCQSRTTACAGCSARVRSSHGTTASPAVRRRDLPHQSRGNRRSAIFLDDYDRRTFLSRLAYVVSKYEWECNAFCLLTTHYHMILTTPKPNIAAGMQYLNSRYAEYFNGRNALSGHVFQGRYWSTIVESDEQLLNAHRYVARNPVRAGICRHPADWPWSSYAAVVGRQAFSFVRIDKLLRQFGTGNAALRALRRFIELGP